MDQKVGIIDAVIITHVLCGGQVSYISVISCYPCAGMLYLYSVDKIYPRGYSAGVLVRDDRVFATLTLISRLIPRADRQPRWGRPQPTMPCYE